MKKITLYSPSIRNDGSYIDAGETVAVGDGAAEIAADRAKAIVDAFGGASETAAKADAKPGND